MSLDYNSIKSFYQTKHLSQNKNKITMPQITAGSSKNPMAARMAALAIGSSQATDGSTAGVSGSMGTGIYMDVDEDEEDEDIPVPVLATTGKYVSFFFL